MNMQINEDDLAECIALITGGSPDTFKHPSTWLITRYLAIGLKPSLISYMVICNQLFPDPDPLDTTAETVLPPMYPEKFNWILWTQIVAEIKLKFPNLALGHWQKLLEEFIGRKHTMSFNEAIAFVMRLVPQIAPTHTSELN